MKKQNPMKETACFIVLCLLLIHFSIGISYAADNQVSSLQKIKVSGTVSDENGAPLVGATIAVKGTLSGTSCDAEGKYSIEIPADAKILIFSFVGMET
jgi:protocatechuate 3,4-dioxygenase beta subunit